MNRLAHIIKGILLVGGLFAGIGVVLSVARFFLFSFGDFWGMIIFTILFTGIVIGLSFGDDLW